MGDTNMSRHLGGSAVTEITLKSPRELTFHRTAPAGFTGFELAALADWIDNPAFPGYVQPEKLRDRSRRLRQQRPPAAPVAPSAAPALPKPPAPTNAPPSKPAAAPRR
jgi:hypothetical protein